MINRLRRGDPSVDAEATAIHLVRSGRPGAVVELYPEVTVGERTKTPDFRVREGDGEWTYVEVTCPDMSQSEERARAILGRLAAIVGTVQRSFAVEVFLRREPSNDEEVLIATRIPSLCAQDGGGTEQLPNDLGLLLLNHTAPGLVVVQVHPGEESMPRIALSRTIGGGVEPHRHITVRMAYSDARARQFLEAEAKQLPKSHPGLIMVAMFRAPGGMKTWEPLLKARLQPTLHMRVSGICLFAGGLEPTDAGEAWVPRTKTLINPHGRLPLPHWVVEALQTHRRPAHEEAAKRRSAS